MGVPTGEPDADREIDAEDCLLGVRGLRGHDAAVVDRHVLDAAATRASTPRDFTCPSS